MDDVIDECTYEYCETDAGGTESIRMTEFRTSERLATWFGSVSQPPSGVAHIAEYRPHRRVPPTSPSTAHIAEYRPHRRVPPTSPIADDSLETLVASSRSRSQGEVHARPLSCRPLGSGPFYLSDLQSRISTMTTNSTMTVVEKTETGREVRGRLR